MGSTATITATAIGLLRLSMTILIRWRSWWQWRTTMLSWNKGFCVIPHDQSMARGYIQILELLYEYFLLTIFKTSDFLTRIMNASNFEKEIELTHCARSDSYSELN